MGHVKAPLFGFLTVLGLVGLDWVVIGIVGLVMVGIEGRWEVVRVQGSKSRWGEGGQHWSCMGWT